MGKRNVPRDWNQTYEITLTLKVEAVFADVPQNSSRCEGGRRRLLEAAEGKTRRCRILGGPSGLCDLKLRLRRNDGKN